MAKQPIDKDYLIESLQSFESKVLAKRYIKDHPQSDYAETDPTSMAYIKNKPILPVITNDLTDERKNRYEQAYTNMHTHKNKSVLDKLDEDGNGDLLYNGNSIKGIVGEDGKSAYEIAVDNGFVGTEDEWLESLKGNDGQDGNYIVNIYQSKTSNNDGGENEVTVMMSDYSTYPFTFKNGSKGSQGDIGVGIQSIKKVSSVGVTDTYRILMTDGTDYSFTVNNATAVNDLSQLNNDVGFITNTVDNLVNYYKQDEVYTKKEITNLLNNFSNGLAVIIVNALPNSNISTTTIYLVDDGSGNNVYEQWMYINGQWASLGLTSVNLSAYYTNTEVDNLLLGYVTTSELLTTLSAYTKTKDLAKVALSGSFNDLKDLPTIPTVATIINDNVTGVDTTYSSDRLEDNFAKKTDLNNKVDKVNGKGLSTNDFTYAEKIKLNSIDDGANYYVLPSASDTVKGGVKVDGTTIDIDADDVIHVIGGVDGSTPAIDPSTKHWFIDGQDTGVLAEAKDGADGKDGKDGTVLTIDPDTKHWLLDGTDSGVVAEGTNGKDGKDGKSITSITKDDNNNLIVTFSDGSTQNIGQLNIDVQADFLTSDGFGNLRYYNGKLQYYDTALSIWSDIIISGSGSGGSGGSGGSTGGDYTLYGFKLDQNESDPASMITYLSDCKNANYTPVHMDYSSGTFNYGDWGNAWFIKNLKPCMLKYDGTVDYELDPNDYTKKLDGTASDIANDSYGGNAMVGIPKVYWKIVDNGDNTANVYFSDKQVDTNFHCWSHIDNNGNEIDYCYMPIYNGSNVNSKLRSLSGKAPMVSQTATTEITYAKANNLTSDIIWYTEVFSDRMLINLLLLLIGKSTDTQTVFGTGNNNSYVSASNTGIKNTGTMNTKGLFWGNQDNKSGVKVFGIENWYGNQWRRIGGCINDKGTQKIKMTYGQSDGSTYDGYNETGSGYISIGSATPSGTSGGYISKMIITDNGLIPTIASGSATTYYCDGLWFNNSQVNYASVGGSSGCTSRVGTLYSSLNATASHASATLGAALSCKPLA